MDNYYLQEYGYNSPPPYPGNHLVLSILVTIFCCLPLGIAAIVYSSKVDGQYMMREYEAAYHSSRMAKRLCIWSILLPILPYLLLAAILILGVGIEELTKLY